MFRLDTGGKNLSKNLTHKNNGTNTMTRKEGLAVMEKEVVVEVKKEVGSGKEEIEGSRKRREGSKWYRIARSRQSNTLSRCEISIPTGLSQNNYEISISSGISHSTVLSLPVVETKKMGRYQCYRLKSKSKTQTISIVGFRAWFRPWIA